MPVATRQYMVEGDPSALITIAVGSPELDPESRQGDWRCPFAIQGADLDVQDHAYGVDSLQALLLAIEGVRVKLRASGRDLNWFDPASGDLGLPRLIPTSYGWPFIQEIETHIDQEIARFDRLLAGLRPRGEGE